MVEQVVNFFVERRQNSSCQLEHQVFWMLIQNKIIRLVWFGQTKLIIIRLDEKIIWMVKPN